MLMYRILKAPEQSFFLDGMRRRLVVYPSGPALRTKDGIDILPFRQFANLLATDTLWSPPES